MHLLYNGQLLPDQQLHLLLSNRAFQYNDGFFETLIVQNGQLRFWQDHQDRMQEAAKVLHLQLPELYSEPLFAERLLQLAEQNNASSYGRLKLKVWRSGAGLYTPETNTVDWLATAQPTTIAATAPIRVDVCQNVHTSFSPFSFFKGPNALLYVIAGIEKKASGADDMLLLSPAGHVAELISSNLFWINNNTLYTPALETGCVNGIMRRNILRWCKTAGIEVVEIKATLAEFYSAEAVVAGNVTGIRCIAQVKDTLFNPEHPLADWLRNSLAQV